MTTRKEKLANKRAEQAARRAEKSKEANAGDQKADQKADPNLDAEIKIVELQLETLRKACNQFIHKYAFFIAFFNKSLFNLTK